VRQQRNIEKMAGRVAAISLLVESAGTQWSLIALSKAAGFTPQRAIK